VTLVCSADQIEEGGAIAVTEAPAGGYVGSRETKHNGDLFLTGRATYFNDVALPNTAHAAVLRSPYAHARIKSIDTSAAEASPQVIAALTGADIQAGELSGPIPFFIDPAVFGGQTRENFPLAIGKVLMAGQPVAAVVAETAADAEAALDLITVDYEVLDPLLEPDEALADGAVVLNDGWDNNIVITIPFVEGDAEAALAEADNVIEDTFYVHRHSTQPIEPRGNMAHWETDGTLTFYGSIQNPHPLRLHLSQALGVSESGIRVIAPFVGGGLGLKMHGHPEEALVCILAKIVDRPVKWLEDRRETLLIGGLEQKHTFKVGFSDDGAITALHNRIVANIGMLGSAPGWGMAFLSALGFPSGYKVPVTDVSVDVVTTNKGIWNATRGYGKQGTNIVMERMVDLISRKLDLDRIAVRRRNMITKDEFPYATNSGLNIDSGDYHAALDKLEVLIDYEGTKKEQARLREEGRYLGIGVTFELTPESADIPGTIVGGFDSAQVKMDPSGNVTVLSGTTTPGSGNDTGLAQIVADEVGVTLDKITVIQGDTETCPYGFGNYSGRSIVSGGNSAVLAGRDIGDKIREGAALLLEAGGEDIELSENMARVAGAPDKAIPIPNVAETIYTLNFAIPGIPEPPLESTRVYKPENIRHTPDEKGRIQPYPTYSYAMHGVVVEVDPETGVVDIKKVGIVHDCGTMINPLFIEGQMAGAVAMGIGNGFSEELRYDENGVPLSTRFKAYLMPRAGDLPPIELVHQVTKSPFTLLGTKGAGEAGVGGGMSVILNAVDDALAPLGVTIRELPVNPPNVLKAINEAASNGGQG
jgi:carbon-monoxide dehydrogenase large subunit